MNISIFGSTAPKFVYNYNVAPVEIAADAGTDELQLQSALSIYTGQKVRFATTDTLPAPLAINTDYFIRDVSGINFKVSLTRFGTAIDLTTEGTGTHTLISEVTVNLDYWVPLKEDPDTRNVKQESELEADRIILPRGEYLEIEGRINLYKYADTASRQSKFAEIYQFKNQNVCFWKHRDGSAYVDENGDEVLFYLESVIPRNLTTLDYRDVLYLRFLSLRGIDYQNSFTIIPTLEEIVMSNDF